MSIPSDFIIYTDCDGVIFSNQKIWIEHTPADIFDPRNAPFLRQGKCISNRDRITTELFKNHLIFMSQDERVGGDWCRERGLEYLQIPRDPYGKERYNILSQHYQNRFGIDAKDKYVYVGDSLPDYECLLNSECGFVPMDHCQYLGRKIQKLNHVHKVNVFGGAGVLEEVIFQLEHLGYFDIDRIIE